MNSCISSGIPSFDSIFGGGISNRRVIFLEEDAHNMYATLIVKYFLAEGVVSQNRICIATMDPQYANLINELPAESTNKRIADTRNADQNNLDIAWRYAKSSGPQGSIQSTKAYSGHRFDLSQTLITRNYVTSHLFQQIHEDLSIIDSTHELFESVLGRIQTIVNDGTSTPLRIVLPSVASPLWGSPSVHHVSSLRPDLSRFLLRLKAIVRGSASATALVTVPHHVLEDNPCLRERLVAVSDYAIQLESYAGSEKEANPVFKDYRGGFHVKKIPFINALCPNSRPETLDLAFKVRTQNFIIEPLYLPPDLSETVSRTMSRGGDLHIGQGCGSGSKTKLEF